MPFAKRLAEKARYANDFDGDDLGLIDLVAESIAEGTLRERVWGICVGGASLLRQTLREQNENRSGVGEIDRCLDSIELDLEGGKIFKNQCQRIMTLSERAYVKDT